MSSWSFSWGNSTNIIFTHFPFTKIMLVCTLFSVIIFYLFISFFILFTSFSSFFPPRTSSPVIRHIIYATKYKNTLVLRNLYHLFLSLQMFLSMYIFFYFILFLFFGCYSEWKATRNKNRLLFISYIFYTFSKFYYVFFFYLFTFFCICLFFYLLILFYLLEVFVLSLFYFDFFFLACHLFLHYAH